MPLFDINGTQITKYNISDGDSFSYTNANGEYVSRVRLDYSTGETLNNTEMDSQGNIIYNDDTDLKKSKEIQKLTSILKGQSAFDNYKQNANQAKEVLDQIVKKYNVKVVGRGTGESNIGKYETANLVVDVNGKQIPMSSIMKNVGLGYSIDKKGIVSGQEYLNEIQNGVSDAQSKLAKIDEMFKTGKAETRNDFFYASAIPTSTLITRDMLKERETVNNDYIKYGEQFIPQLADRLRKMGNIPGGEAVLYKMKQNPIGYGYSNLGELESDIKKDPIKIITKGLIYNQSAYAASIAADAFNVTGGKNRSAADLAYLEGLAVLGEGSRDAIAGFVDSITSFNTDGSVGTHNRKTHLDRNSFGNQLMNEKASQGKFSWAIDRFFDGVANGSLIGNIVKYLGLGDNASLNESIIRDTMANDSNGFLMSASNIAGNMAGMITEAAILRKGSSGLKGMKANSVMQASNTAQVLQYSLHGGALPMIQAINEAEENPLWEQYVDKGWKESDFTKVLADGIQNMATMYIGNKVLEPIFGTMMKGQWLKKAMMVGRELPASGEEKIAKNLLNNIFANHVKFPAMAFAIDIAGDMGLDYASVRLTNNIMGYDGLEESVFTKSTTAALGDMFSEDMLARTLAQRFGARVFKNISSTLTKDVLQSVGKLGSDEPLMGEVKWYEKERAKYNVEDGTKRGMSASEKFTVWMSNAMFGNSLKQLDLTSRYLDKGFLDEAKAMDANVDKSHIETQMNTTLLRWMVQENTLNVFSKMIYGNLVDGAKNKFLSDKFEDKATGEIFRISDLYEQYRAGYSVNKPGINSKLEAVIGSVSRATHNYSIDGEAIKRLNSDDPDNIKYMDEIVDKIIDTEATEARVGARILFSNLNPKGMTLAKNSFDRVIANKGQKLSLNLQDLQKQKSNLIALPEHASKAAELDAKIKQVKQSIEDLNSVKETIKNPNYAENLQKDFAQISEEFFTRTGLKKGASISADEAKTILDNISAVLGPKKNDLLWKMGLGNGLNSDEFRKVFIALRESYKRILSDESKDSKQKLNALFDDFSNHSAEILKTAFNSLRDEIKSASTRTNATEREKFNAITTLNSLKMLINLTPFKQRGEYAKQIRSLIQNQDVFNLIVSTKLKGEIDASSDRDKYVADMKDGLITEILESATVLGSLREFMSIDTAAGKMETRAEIARMYNSSDPGTKAMATRLVKAYDEPKKNINDNIRVIGMENFEFPNLFDLVNINAQNTGWRDIANNALVASAISKFEKMHYKDVQAEETIEISGGIVHVSRNSDSGKNEYEISVIKNYLDHQNESNGIIVATSMAKACINEYSGMNTEMHTNHISFFGNDEIKANAINGKPMDSVIDDINKTFSTIDILGVTRILYSLLGRDGVVEKIKSEYVAPALSTMKGFRANDIDKAAKAIVDRAMAYRSKTVNIGIDANGKTIKASLSPVTVGNTFTSVKAKHGFYGYMTTLEFPEDIDEKTKDDLITKYLKDNNAMSAGVFNNNLNTTIVQFSHDINRKDVFKSLFTKEYKDSVFEDYVKALNTSNDIKDKNGSLLAQAYNIVMKENPESFDDFSKKFSEKYGKMLMDHVSGIVDNKLVTNKEKKAETETDYRRQITESLVDEKLSSITEATLMLKKDIEEKLKVYSANEQESLLLAKINKDLESAIRQIDSQYKPTILAAVKEHGGKRNADEEILKTINTAFSGFKKNITILSNASKVLDPISFTNVLNEVESINESSFYSKIRKDISNDARPTFKKSKTVEELATENVNLIKKTMEDSVNDKSELFIRTMMAGSAAYLADYYSKRGSYHITAQVDPKVMAEHLLSGKEDRKVMAIFAETDADGNQVFPKDMIDALALMGDTASGKITAGMSKNQMYVSKDLSTNQIKELINIAGIDNVKKLLGMEMVGANPLVKKFIGEASDIDMVANRLSNAICHNEFDFIVLTPQSFKGMNIDILKTMKQNMTGDSGMIFSGTRKELFDSTEDGFTHGLARGILDSATHAYNKTNADEKEASSQLDGSLLGRLYLSQYLAKYNNEHIKNIIKNDQGLVDISTMFEKVQRDVLLNATIDKKVTGLTGSSVGFELDKDNGDFLLEGNSAYNKLKIPSLSLGTVELGLLILQIKDIKDNSLAKSLGTKLANRNIATGEDIANALKILTDAKVLTEFDDNGSKAYSMVAVRYPMVGGTNFTAVKIKGFKNGSKGLSVQLGPYKELLGGDWDGDTVQLLEVDMDYFESLRKAYGSNSIYKALEDNVVEMTASARLSKISANIIADPAAKDLANIGSVLAKVQKMKQLLPYIAMMHDGSTIKNIVGKAIHEAFNKKVDVQYIQTVSPDKLVEDAYYEKVQYGTETNVKYLQDQSRFILLKEDNGILVPVGSLGGVRFGDNDLVVVKESNGNRIYKRGEVFFTTIDDTNKPGFKRIIAASRDVKNVISVTGDNFEQIKEGKRFDSDLMFMNEARITSLDTIDRFWDGASTSRVKLLSIMTALGIDEENDNSLNRLVELQAASAISINFMNKETVINNKSFKVNKDDLTDLNEAVKKIAKHMNEGGNGYITLDQMKTLTKLTGRKLPTGKDLTDLMTTVESVFEKYELINNLPASLKGILDVLYQYRSKSKDNPAYNTIERLKNSGRLAKEFDIKLTDWSDNNGSKFKQVKAAHLIDALINGFGVKDVVSAGKTERAFLSQAADLIANKDAYIKSDHGVFIDDVRRVIERDYKGQIIPSIDTLAKDVIRVLEMTNIEFATKTMLDVKSSDPQRADITQAKLLDNFLNGIGGNRAVFFVAAGDAAKKNIGVVELTKRMTKVMLDDETSEIDKAIANGILNSLDASSQSIVGLIANGITPEFIKKVVAGNGGTENRISVTEKMIEGYNPIPVLATSDIIKTSNILNGGTCQ